MCCSLSVAAQVYKGCAYIQNSGGLYEQAVLILYRSQQ